MNVAATVSNGLKQAKVVTNIVEDIVRFKPNGMTPLPAVCAVPNSHATATQDTIKVAKRERAQHKYEYQVKHLRRNMFHNFHNVAVCGVSTDAGAGHLRPMKSLSAVIKEGMFCIQVHTITTATHSTGSRSEWIQFGAQFLGTHPRLQNMVYAPIIHQILLERDGQNVLDAIEPLLQEAVSQKINEVLLIHTNPDPAFIAGFYKSQLESTYNLRLTNVVVMTDHFVNRSQCIWNLIDADIIVAPDVQTRKLTKRWLRYWEKKMRKQRLERGRQIPEVVVCGYPQHPVFQLNVHPSLEGKRAKELAADYEGPVDVAMPLGGGSPGMPFLAELAENMCRLNNLNIWTVFKKGDDPETMAYEKKMRHIDAGVIPVADNTELIDTYNHRFQTKNIPTIVIVKPGELSNQMIFAPDQVGGAIFLFVEPVGDQEVQNMLFFQSEEGGYVLPSKEKNNTLISQILQLVKSGGLVDEIQNHELSGILSDARGWRGLALPPDPLDAALCFYGLKQYGVFHAMSQFERKVHTNIAMSDTGSKDFFAVLDAAYGCHLAIRNKREHIRMHRASPQRHTNKSAKGRIRMTVSHSESPRSYPPGSVYQSLLW